MNLDLDEFHACTVGDVNSREHNLDSLIEDEDVFQRQVPGDAYASYLLCAGVYIVPKDSETKLVEDFYNSKCVEKKEKMLF